MHSSFIVAFLIVMYLSIMKTQCMEISLDTLDDLLHINQPNEDHMKSNEQSSGQNPYNVSELLPIIDAQSVLSEGIGWEGTIATETSYQVIISVTGTNPLTKSLVAFPNIPLQVKLDGGALRCLIENGSGNGKFSKCDLSSEPFTFTTNASGRVSFSIPIPGLYNSEVEALPAFFIRTDFMPKNSW